MTDLRSVEAVRKVAGPFPLNNGDRMKQPEFHRRYELYPDETRFELIGGIVFMASPARVLHGDYHSKLGSLLAEYADDTPGVHSSNESTAILSEDSEPQPDHSLRIDPECGGQIRISDDGYIVGAPELLAEIAYSSRAIDLHQKRVDYQEAGVLEYIVLSIEDRQLFWFHFPSGTMIESDSKGVQRSRCYPGLWLHQEALIALDMKRARAVLRRGLATKAHREFTRQLAQARKK